MDPLEKLRKRWMEETSKTEDGMLTPRQVVELALETKPDAAYMLTRVFIRKEYGPFLDGLALDWFDKNRELIDNALEEGLPVGLAIEAGPIDNQDKDTPKEKVWLN